LLGSLALPGFKPRGLATDGSMLYAASAAAGIHVIDVSVPSAPALITVFSEADASYVALNLRAPYLYVADGQRHLLVLDVTEPAAPRRVGRATLPANGQQIALRGDHALVAAGAAGLRVVAVANPELPVEVGHSTKTSKENAVGLALNGHLAYVADRSITSGESHYRKGGLRVIDVAQPEQPVQLGNWPADVMAVDADGDQAFVGLYHEDRESAVAQVDVVKPAMPVLRASTNVPIPASQAVHALGHSVFVADHSFNRLNLGDATLPHLAWSLGLPDFDQKSYAPYREFVFGPGRAYVDLQSAGVAIIDLADLRQPAWAGTIVERGLPMAAVAGHVYLKPFSGPMAIYDTQIPSAPQRVGSVPGSDFAVYARVVGRHLYLVDNFSAQLKVLDISDPRNPVPVNQVVIPPAFALEVEGQRLYLGTQGAFDARLLQVYSLAPAPAVELRGEVEVDHHVRGMAVCDRTVFISKPTLPGGGVLAVDVSNANAPEVVARHELSKEFAMGVACLPGGVVALNVREGVLILRYER
jgi:hypothetical protein